MLYKNNNIKFILGSSSPRRLSLLKQINIYPDTIYDPDINEEIYKKELPLSYVKRMASEKMKIVKKKFPNDLILTADTVVYVGRKIMNKTDDKIEAFQFLKILSGRRHKISTAFNIFLKDKIDTFRVVTSIVKLKRLSEEEIENYLFSNEWRGKAGGYGIQGSAEKFIQFMSGSYSNIVGLPLNQIYGSLNSIGYK